MFRRKTNAQNKILGAKGVELDLHSSSLSQFTSEGDGIQSGDELLNLNSYDYLYQLAESIPEELRKQSTVLENVYWYCHKDSQYNPQYPYGDLYRNFMLDLEENLETYYQQSQNVQNDKKEETSQATDLTNALDQLVERLYVNENVVLLRSYTMVKDVIECTNQTTPEIEANITLRLAGRQSINFTTPEVQGSTISRARSFLASNFRPQTVTNIPSVRIYAYLSNLQFPATELRLGTQGERCNNVPRVNPLFKRFLMVQRAKSVKRGDQKDKITHVYFNNLGRDRGFGYTDLEGFKEKELTEHLHSLEHEHPNVAVITLPADKGLLSKSLLEDTSKRKTYKEAYNQFFNVAIGKSNEKYQDFFISENIQKKLYGEDLAQKEEIIKRLLKNSFNYFGYNKKSPPLTPAEATAVYFHFIKYELTNFILENLHPDTFNMTCKDGIDRGGIASAYYNLMKSIKSGNPMTKEEFEQALHAAPTLVKGRGMNHHTRMIWNALYFYVDRSSQSNEVIPKWLPEWVDQNKPDFSKNRNNMLTDSNTFSKFNNLKEVVLSGIEEYKNTCLQPGRFFSGKGKNRASVYTKLLNDSQSELATYIITYALISDNNGMNLKNTILKKLQIESRDNLMKELIGKIKFELENIYGEIYSDKQGELLRIINEEIIDPIVTGTNNQYQSDNKHYDNPIKWLNRLLTPLEIFQDLYPQNIEKF